MCVGMCGKEGCVWVCEGRRDVCGCVEGGREDCVCVFVLHAYVYVRVYVKEVGLGGITHP